jgi:hypothetical protein
MSSGFDLSAGVDLGGGRRTGRTRLSPTARARNQPAPSSGGGGGYRGTMFDVAGRVK